MNISLTDDDLESITKTLRDVAWDTNRPPSASAVSSFISATERLSREVSHQGSRTDYQLQVFEGLGNQAATPGQVLESVVQNHNFQNQTWLAEELCEDASSLPQPPTANFSSDANSLFQPPTANFSSKGQSRTGSHHGRGGRRVGSGFKVREQYSKYVKSIIFERIHIMLSKKPERGTESIVLEELIIELCRTSKIHGNVPELIQKYKSCLLSKLEEYATSKRPYTVQHLPFCVLGVSARFSKTDAVLLDGLRTANSMDRHIVNTWLDKTGAVRCTCLGSTQYSILARNDEFELPCCEHSQTFIDIFNYLGRQVFNIPELDGRLLFKSLSRAVPDLLEPLKDHIPFFRGLHKEQSAVYVCEDVDHDRRPSWVPIRCVRRSGMKYLCAFCDSMPNNSCRHVKGFLDLRHENDALVPMPFEDDFTEMETPKHTPPIQFSSTTGPISFLTLAPVNCRRALRTELEVCQKVRENSFFVLRAPLACIYCQGSRLEDSRDTNTSGIVMCTLGACRMEVETYKCSACNRRFSAEGRREGVFLHSICSAATHALLRDELIGFSLGNGTLTSRLNQLHSRLAALEDSGLLPSSIPSKSTKMCIDFAKLVVTNAPDSLFWCATCQSRPAGKVSVPRLVCIDGIWAGYLRKSKRAFDNISVPCQTEEKPNAKNRRCQRRPKTSFIRLEKTVTLLLLAIRGEKIEVTNASINAVVAAVRLINPTVLPNDFYRTSVCGNAATDFGHDEANSILQQLRNLTNSMFDERTLLYRLLKPLQAHFLRLSKLKKKKKKPPLPGSLHTILSESDDDGTGIESYNQPVGSKRKKLRDPVVFAAMLSQALQISPIGGVSEEEEPIRWNSIITNVAQRDDLGKDIFSLYKSLIQGPLTHLIPRNDLTSTRLVANDCVTLSPHGFMKETITKERYKVVTGEKENQRYSNVTESNRTLLSSLGSAEVVDSESGSKLLQNFGKVLLESIAVVETFYEFYEKDKEKGSSTAAAYARNWSSMDGVALRRQFEELAQSSQFQPGAGVDYDDPFTTGTFFPSFPQIRPLPFNNEGRKVPPGDPYGFCSKHYLQKNGAFTPGAVTFCCGCPHPILIGFKVLEWDEGPRAILDVLVSRFPSFSRYVIYDFACGVHKSASHPLWWAIENGTLVSDPFHGCNHKCSPAFKPYSHPNLDMANTISHEQRNKPIAKIKSSLQQTSQDTYIALLAFQVTINNISAKTRTAGHSQLPEQNRSAADIEWGYFKRLNLSCFCCDVISNEHVHVDESAVNDARNANVNEETAPQPKQEVDDY